MKKSTARKYGATRPPRPGRPYSGKLPPLPLPTDDAETAQAKRINRLRVQVARSLARWQNAREAYGPLHDRTQAAARRNARVARAYHRAHQTLIPFDQFEPRSDHAPSPE